MQVHGRDSARVVALKRVVETLSIPGCCVLIDALDLGVQAGNARALRSGDLLQVAKTALLDALLADLDDRRKMSQPRLWTASMQFAGEPFFA